MSVQHAASQQAEALNMRLVGHTDLNGHGDCMHVNVQNGVAYIGHMGESRVGTSVVDVSDPRQPRVICQLETPHGTHSHKVQVVDDILLVNYERNPLEQAETWQGGLKVFDVSSPAEPRDLAFVPMPGKGVHRMTYWTAPYAYMSGSDDGFIDQFLRIFDLSDPSNPRDVGRWWLPGQWTGGGETPSWTPGGHGAGGPGARRKALHHPLMRGDRAYCGWWDAGLVILDLSELSAPKLVSQLEFGSDVSTATHTALPVPGRDVLVVTDEQLAADCNGMQTRVRVVDIADELQPKVISEFPVPQGDFCSRGGRFGPHNLHEMRPGTSQDSNEIYVTWFNAGVRVVNISDPFAPREVAYYVPEAPPGRASIQLNDLVVDANGLVYVTDRFTGGLYILERTG
ncbi:MAG: hypothetical protein JOZ81_04495 [Chloroflexi bacterium]|nr:hypothetical protein [Chloroflexota bacterium]